MSLLIRICLVVGVMSGVVVADEGQVAETKDDLSGTWSAEAKAIVTKMAKTVKSMKTYRDEGQYISTNPFSEIGGDKPRQTSPCSLIMKQGGAFLAHDDEGTLLFDGKTVTLCKKRSRRYRTRPVGAGETVVEIADLHLWRHDRKGHVNAFLYLAGDPQKALQEKIHHVTVTGREVVGDDPCVVLSGEQVLQWIDPVPVTLWFRETDGLLRRYEIDFTPRVLESIGDTAARLEKKLAKEEDGCDTSEQAKLKRQELEKELEQCRKALASRDRATFVYDAGKIRVNEKVSSKEMAWRPPVGYKKAEWLFDHFEHFDMTAMPFELSGKPVPGFEADGINGEAINSDDFKGKTGVLVLLDLSLFGKGLKFEDWDTRATWDKAVAVLQDAAKAMPDDLKVVTVLSISSSAMLDIDDEAKTDITPELVRSMHKASSLPGVIVHDTSGASRKQFMTDRDEMIVLVRDGVIQGKYSIQDHGCWDRWLKSDLERLAKGQTLRAGKRMSRDDLMEMDDQFRPVVVKENEETDLVHKERLVEAWKIRVEGLCYCTSLDSEYGFWIDTDSGQELIGPDGNAVSTIQYHPELIAAQNDSSYPSKQKTWLHVCPAGPGGRVVLLGLIKKELRDDQAEVTLTLWSQEGEEVWTKQLPSSRTWMDLTVQAGDVDGDEREEIILLVEDTLYVLDFSGEILSSRTTRMDPYEICVVDRDLDGKSEIYVSSRDRLARYDYVGDASHQD